VECQTLSIILCGAHQLAASFNLKTYLWLSEKAGKKVPRRSTHSEIDGDYRHRNACRIFPSYQSHTSAEMPVPAHHHIAYSIYDRTDPFPSQCRSSYESRTLAPSKPFSANRVTAALIIDWRVYSAGRVIGFQLKRSFELSS